MPSVDPMEEKEGIGTSVLELVPVTLGDSGGEITLVPGDDEGFENEEYKSFALSLHEVCR